MPSVRIWLFRHISARLQRKIQGLFEEQIRRASGSQSSSNRHSSNSSPREKLDIDSIEAKRFDKENSDDYVEFEELPR